MNHSAGNLDAKIGELAQKQGIAMPKVKVGTVHKIYGAKVDPMKYVPKISTDIGQFVVDELGQLGSDTAGMAARRWHSDAKIVLSVGPGQLLPIGPGQIGEDLLMCLKETEDKMKGWQLKKLTENYRTKSTPGGPPPAIGIVQFFCSIAEGRVSQFEVMVTNNEQMPQGLVLFPIRPSSRGSGFGDSLEFAPAGGIMYETPGSEPRFISPLDRDGSEIIAVTFKQLKADMADRKISVGIDLLEDGEEIWLKVASSATRTARWKKGMRGTVVKTNEDGKIVIKPVCLPSQAVTAKSITVSRAQIRRYCAITAHSAQGLETDFGVVVALRSRITNKRWLYTAVSRCKRMCVVIYEEGSLDYIVNNREINTPRRTLFPTFFRMFRKERGV